MYRGTYHNTPVAIKEMITGGGGPEKAAADRAEDDSFIKEFEHLKSLRHPNVVQFFGAACSSNPETAEQRRVLVMELAACSLKDVVRGEHVPEGGYPVVTSLNWARQVAAGLRYIHDRRMIHFDIKVRTCGSTHVVLASPISNIYTERETHLLTYSLTHSHTHTTNTTNTTSTHMHTHTHTLADTNIHTSTRTHLPTHPYTHKTHA